MKIPRLIIAGLALAISACDRSPEPAATDDVTTRAGEIARASIIVDTHIDVPVRLQYKPDDISQATEGGDYDYPRAIAGGLNAPFMSIYTPARLEDEGRSKAVAEELIDLVKRIAAEAPDKYAIAFSPADVEAHFAEGRI